MTHKEWNNKWVYKELIFIYYYQIMTKQELIPLDVEKIIEEIKPCFDWSAVRYYQLREVLSKYSISKQELIPLDMEKIIDEYVKKMQEVFNKWDEKRDAWYELKQILSKYGATPQKKWTREDIKFYITDTSETYDEWYIKHKERLEYIEWFLEYHWVLQE